MFFFILKGKNDGAVDRARLKPEWTYVPPGFESQFFHLQIMMNCDVIMMNHL